MVASRLVCVTGWCALLAATAAGVAHAAAPGFEITPFAGYRDGGQFVDNSGAGLDLSGSTSAALAINWRAGWPGAQYELFYSRQNTQTNAVLPLGMRIEYLHVGGTTLIGELDSRVEPFAAGGIGVALLTPDAALLNRETRVSFSLGGGVRIPLATHVRLRLEARGYVTWLGGSGAIFCEGGCVIAAKGSALFQYEALAGVSVGF